MKNLLALAVIAVTAAAPARAIQCVEGADTHPACPGRGAPAAVRAECAGGYELVFQDGVVSIGVLDNGYGQRVHPQPAQLMGVEQGTCYYATSGGYLRAGLSCSVTSPAAGDAFRISVNPGPNSLSYSCTAR